MSTPNPRRRGNQWLYFSALILILIVFIATLALFLPQWLQERFPTPTPLVLVAGEPRTVLNPAQGYGGTVVQVQGTGWPAGHSVLITLNDAAGLSGVLASAAADSEGRFTVGFLYPSDARWTEPGPHTVIAYIAASTVRSDALFTVLAPTTQSTLIVTTTVAPITTTATVAATATALANATFTPGNPTAVPTITPLPPPTVVVIQNWRGDYWNNPDLAGAPALIRDDANLNFVWGFESPAPMIERDNFSTRWVRTVDLPAGRYRFNLEIDDGARLYLDDRLVLDEWRDGSQRTVSTEQTLSAGSHQLRLEYYERSGLAIARLWWDRGTEIRNWRGSYFANPNLQGVPVLVRDDANIDFSWGLAAPAPDLPADGFSVRWERAVNFAAGRYRFQATADDGIRVWLDDNLLLDEWHDSTATTYVREVSLVNRTYRVSVEYYENNLGAQARLGWEPLAETTATPSVTPSVTRTPAPVVSLSPTWTPLGATSTPPNTLTPTWTPVVTADPTLSLTPTWTPIPTPTATGIATATPTPSATVIPTATATSSATLTATATLTSTAATTLTATATLTATITPTFTLTPSLTPTTTLTVTVTPTLTGTATVTVTQTITSGVP